MLYPKFFMLENENESTSNILFFIERVYKVLKDGFMGVRGRGRGVEQSQYFRKKNQAKFGKLIINQLFGKKIIDC